MRLERTHLRVSDAHNLSDADARVVRQQSDDGGLVEDVPAAQHIPLRTDRAVSDALDDLAAVLDARLATGGP